MVQRWYCGPDLLADVGPRRRGMSTLHAASVSGADVSVDYVCRQNRLWAGRNVHETVVEVAEQMLNASSLIVTLRPLLFGHAFCHFAAAGTQIWFEESLQRPEVIRPAGDVGHLRGSSSSTGFQLPTALTTHLTQLSE